MPFAPRFAGPQRPVAGTPPRRLGSVRRTTTIDVTRPDGHGGRAVADARGRDLRTGPDGTAEVVATARLVVDLDAGRVVRAIEVGHAEPAPPDPGALAALVGCPAAGGFRREVGTALADDVAAGGLWHLLLDDLVGAMIVSGVSQQHAEAVAGGGPLLDMIRANADRVFDAQADICAGWARDASMLTELRRTGDLPVPLGPPAPPLEGGDPLGWHEMAPLDDHVVRRRRRLDVGPVDDAGGAPLDAHFRDSHVDGTGLERAVHEYRVDGRIDVAAGSLTRLAAEARVLPWQECPAAVDSAGRVVGVPWSELRDHVRVELRGVTTCTHLNDVLRSLGDVGALVAMLGIDDG